MARQRIARVRRSSTSNKAWAGTVTATATTVPAASKVLVGGFSLSNPNIDETILRVVGALAVSSDQQAASELQLGGFGMILVSDAAVAVGITAIPGPVTDIADDGWFVYVPISQHMTFISAVGVLPEVAHIYQFDSRAKRRVQEGQQIAIVAENAHATHGFKLTTTLRMLSMITGT